MNCKICDKELKSFYYFKDIDYFKKEYFICPECYEKVKIIDCIEQNFITIKKNIINKQTSLYFRQFLNKWKTSSFSLINCIKSINKNEINTIHHYYKRYYDILYNCLTYLNLINKKLDEYSIKDINRTKELLDLMHWYYGNGYPMTEQHHQLYHHQFGRDIVSENSLLEFYKNLGDEYYKECKKIVDIIYKHRENKKELLYNLLHRKCQYFENELELQNKKNKYIKNKKLYTNIPFEKMINNAVKYYARSSKFKEEDIITIFAALTRYSKKDIQHEWDIWSSVN